MKKVLSLTLALMMLVMSVSTAFTAQAKPATEQLATLDTLIDGAVDYVKKNSDLSTMSYPDIFTLVDARENALTGDEIDSYVLRVTGDLSSEDSGIKTINDVAAIILTLEKLGYNPEEFSEFYYNFYDKLESYDAQSIDNPYYFRLAIRASLFRDYSTTLADAFIKNYYVMGSGMNYWGYSCDNTAVFLAAIAPLASMTKTTAEKYQKYIADACTIIKSYTTEIGAFCDTVWTTEENTDSTALALAAFAESSDIENAYHYYECLQNFCSFEGSFSGNDPVYATKDALIGLAAYSRIAKSDFHILNDYTPIIKASFDNNGVAQAICQACGKTELVQVYAIGSITLSNTSYTFNGLEKRPIVTVKDIKGNLIAKSNYTVKYTNNFKPGTGKVTVTFKNLYQGSAAKTFKINVAPTTLSSVSAGSKSFTAKINKLSDAKITGYQIQYGTSSLFKDATKKSTTKTSITVKKLKAKKKYYVRVRAYRTIDGKKYYSAWSKSKTVTTKK